MVKNSAHSIRVVSLLMRSSEAWKMNECCSGRCWYTETITTTISRLCVACLERDRVGNKKVREVRECVCVCVCVCVLERGGVCEGVCVCDGECV